MMYFLIPLAVVCVAAVMCLNFKAGFIVADRTGGTGFDVGYYLMTVVGLIAVEASATVYVVRLFL